MSWDNLSKSSSSFVAQDKNAASFSNQAKNSSSYDNQSKVSGLFFLLQEMASYLLQENGCRILLNQSVQWDDGTKGASVFTNLVKH